MAQASLKRTFLKGGLFIGFFAVLHFLHDWFPSPLTLLFSDDGSETVFQHMKIGLWAWAFASLVEYVFWRTAAQAKRAFIESRLGGTILIPYVQTLIWYLAPALVGEIKPLALEVSWSLIACFCAGLLTSVIEQGFEAAPSTRARRACFALLGAVSLFLVARFSFGPLPWIDVFRAR
jgi:hypothetical protein